MNAIQTLARCIGMFVSCVVAANTVVSAADSPVALSSLTAADQETCKRVTQGFIAERERLHSGVYRVSGEFPKLDYPETASYGPFSFLAAFDPPQERFRFDSLRPIMLHPDEGEEGVPTLSTNREQMILTNGIFIRFSNLLNQAEMRKKRPNDGKGYIDPRLLGYIMISARQDNELQWDTLAKLFSSMSFSSVESISDSVTRLTQTWDQDGTGHLFRYVNDFDETKGFAPINREFQAKNANASEWKVLQRTTSEWKKINDVWLPVETTHEAMHRKLPPEKWEIQWEKVNDSVPGSFFQIEDFHLPKGTSAIDYTSGKPVHVRLLQN